MIQDIAIEQLDIHPQNVRKVYTDIDELAESIKARNAKFDCSTKPGQKRPLSCSNRKPKTDGSEKSGIENNALFCCRHDRKRANINDAVGKHAAQRSISKRASTRIPADVGLRRNRNNNRGKDRI